MQIGRGSEKQIGKMVLHSTARLIGGRAARIVITLGGVAVLARLLTPEDFGVVAVAAMILTLGNSLLEGLIDVPTIREDFLDRSGLANLLWVGVVLMSGLCFITWLTAPILAVLLNSPQQAEVLRVLCFGLLLQPFIAASHALLHRQHRFGVSAIFMPISGGVYVLSAIGLALMGFGVWSLIFGQIINLVFTALGLGLLSGIPLLPLTRLRLRAALRLGGVGLITRLLAWIYTNIDTLFASASLGAAATGVYSRAYNLTTQMKSPFEALEQTIRQAFVAQRNVDNASASRATLDGLRLLVLVAAIPSAMLIILREPIVAILLGRQWGDVMLPLSILAASLPARVARLYLDGFSYARGSMRHMLVRNILIVTLLATGLWFWASDGVVVIASIVASLHVVSLLFSGGSVDVAVAGAMTQRFSAMAPGYAAGCVVVVIGELCFFAMPYEGGVEWILRMGWCLFCGICIALMMPKRWLPKNLV